jgi:hypothetical protein
MGATGGPLKELTYRGRTFKGAGDSNVSIVSLGGVVIEHMENGDQSTRRKQSPKAWHITGVKIEIDHEKGDLQFLQEGVAVGEDGDITFTLQDETTYAGTGDIDGEFPNDTGDASDEFEMKGGGKLKKIS